jgi:hypothetical protein
VKISRAAALVLVSLTGCRGRGCDASKTIVADDAAAVPATDLVEACVDGARARCRATDACEPGAAAYWGGIDRCAEQSRRWCRAMVAAPGAAITVDGLRACLDAQARMSCDDRTEPEACVFRGSLPLRAACAFPAQCKSGTCAFDRGKACGRCVDDAPKMKGEPCQFRLDCANGLTCIDAVCAPFKQVGEACEVLECARKLQCANGECTPYAKVGEACADYPGVACSPEGKCVAGTCVAREPPKRPGEACDDSLDCLDFGCVRRKCVSLGEEGAACGDPESTPMCATGLACVDEKCRALDASACK